MSKIQNNNIPNPESQTSQNQQIPKNKKQNTFSGLVLVLLFFGVSRRGYEFSKNRNGHTIGKTWVFARWRNQKYPTKTKNQNTFQASFWFYFFSVFFRRGYEFLKNRDSQTIGKTGFFARLHPPPKNKKSKQNEQKTNHELTHFIQFFTATTTFQPS